MKKRIFSMMIFSLAIVMSLTFATPVKAAGEVSCSNDYVAKIGDQCYANLADAVGAAGDTETTIDVVKDVELTTPITINGNKNIVLNLENVTIKKEGYSFNVADNASLNITGTGNILNTAEGYNSRTSVTIYVGGTSKLTIGKGITVEGYDVISLFGCSDGSKLDLYGTIKTKKDTNNKTDGLPTLGGGINVNSGTGGTVVVHDGAIITGEGVGLYLASPNKTTIGKATVIGATGIAIKSGELTLNGTTVIGTYEYEDPSAWNKGVKTTGAAIQVESDPTNYTGDVKIHINDGTYTSEHSYAFQEYTATDADDTSVDTIEITAGTFESNSEDGKALNLSEKFITKYKNQPFVEAGTMFTNNGNPASDVLDYTNGLGISESGLVGTIYNITVDEVKNGTVKLPKNAVEGEIVTVVYEPKEGFVLDTITVTLDDGSEVKVFGNQFVMPAGNVNVKVTFKEENVNVPSTGDNVLIYVILGTVTLIGACGLTLYYKKVNE